MAKRGRARLYNQWVDVVYEVGFGARTIDLICLDNRCIDLLSSARIGMEIKLELDSGRELEIVVQEFQDVRPAVCRAAIKDRRFRPMP